MVVVECSLNNFTCRNIARIADKFKGVYSVKFKGVYSVFALLNFVSQIPHDDRMLFTKLEHLPISYRPKTNTTSLKRLLGSRIGR
jgi:hypothetical protein